MTNPLNRETMKVSDLIRALEQFQRLYGDRPAYFTDGFFRYGVTGHAESAPNFDAPQCFLIKTFSLTTGMNGPNRPIDLAA